MKYVSATLRFVYSGCPRTLSRIPWKCLLRIFLNLPGLPEILSHPFVSEIDTYLAVLSYGSIVNCQKIPSRHKNEALTLSRPVLNIRALSKLADVKCNL